jgi:hypothetical protein
MLAATEGTITGYWTILIINWVYCQAKTAKIKKSVTV